MKCPRHLDLAGDSAGVYARCSAPRNYVNAVNVRVRQSGLEGTYCTSCGQRDVDLERPIWSLVGDILKEAFELDGRSALTVRTLFLHPGKLTHEFLAGRRRSYTSPLRLYVAISILFFMVAA